MKCVYVGLSGGVDSGTSAALLKEQGYDVTGVFIKIWQPEFLECTWREDRLDAIRVASSLGIAFKEIDLSSQYKKEVIDSMIEQYSSGVTPNPDVLCNEKIKFGVFAKWAWGDGADFLATGHYAQVETKDGHAYLKRGADASKDQSYFLYRITQTDLLRTLFPIGSLQKSEVRRRARDFGLPVSEKADSQGLCFVGDISIVTFLSRYMTVKEGTVLNSIGAVVGRHPGAAFFTVGQRHGFTLNKSTPQESIHFVTSIDTQANTITVSPDKLAAARSSVILTDVHWVTEIPQLPSNVLVQTRYRETPIGAQLKNNEQGELVCLFTEPHVVSAGQSLVVYKGDTCLGGGFIKK